MLSVFRRALHRIPELDWALPETSAYLHSVLAPLDCRVFSPVGDAVCAYFDFGRSETVAFRSDMDALPITERTNLPFASEHPGKMHACGHDGHMAILLGLAEAFGNGCVTPHRNVLLIFQPAEETTGGAAAICRTGVLERCGATRVYGLHLWPELEKGRIAACAGGMMARSSELTAEVGGKSVHLARWQTGCDALEAAARFLTQAYALAEGLPCVLRFGKMTAGTARNALADAAHMEGSLRCLDDRLFLLLKERLATLAETVSAETGCPIRLSYSTGYPPVTNDAALLAEARALLPVEPAEPCFLTDDFSEYQLRVPGVYFRLGTGGAPLHSPQFDFDEAVLEKGLALFSALA